MSKFNALPLIAFILLALLLLLPVPVGAQSAPDGWTTSHVRAGITTYTPSDLGPGEVYSVAVFPRASLNGRSLGDWVLAAAANDPIPPGTAFGPATVRSRTALVVVAARVFSRAGGGPLAGVYTGVSVDGQVVALMRVAWSGKLYDKYQADTLPMIRAMAAGLRAGSVPTAAVPTGRATRGGDIVQGVYAGDQVCIGSDQQELWRNHLRLYLYTDGEYRLCGADDKDVSSSPTGRYQYDPTTGRLEVNRFLNMYNNADDRAACVFGHDGAGKPLVAAKDGIYDTTTVLLYVGPAPRLAPDAEAKAKAAAEIEARRYKWVTPPGRGVRESQIKAVVHYYKVRVYYGGSGVGTLVTDETDLLLNDGTIHRDLPVAPDQLDVTRSRRMEPDKWGRWRRQGGKYVVSWAGGPFQPLRGSVALAGTPSIRLNGHWGAGSSTSNMMGGSYRLWGVTFTHEGRFLKDDSGGYGSSQSMQSAGGPEISTQYDEHGSSTQVLGGNFTVGTQHKKNPNGDRSGTYTISGYTMTLRYDNGQVERTPFYFVDAGHRELSFEGATLGRDDKK